MLGKRELRSGEGWGGGREKDDIRKEREEHWGKGREKEIIDIRK